MSGLLHYSPALISRLKALAGASKEKVAQVGRDLMADATVTVDQLSRALRHLHPNRHFPKGMSKAQAVSAIVRNASKDAVADPHTSPSTTLRKQAIRHWISKLKKDYGGSDAFLQSVIVMMADRTLSVDDVFEVAMAMPFLDKAEVEERKGRKADLFSLMLDKWKKAFLKDTESHLIDDARSVDLMPKLSSPRPTRVLLGRGV